MMAMLSPRGHKYLSILERKPPVSAATLERVLKEQGSPCFPPWLEFQDKYSGYVQPLGRDRALWGIVHDLSSEWLKAGRADVEWDPYDNTWLAMCANLHPSYNYRMDEHGEFLGGPAESFDIYVEQRGLYYESYELGRRELPRDQITQPSFREPILEQLKPCLVPEASDKFFRYYLNDEYLVAENLRLEDLQFVMKRP